MEKFGAKQFLDIAAGAEPIARKLAQIENASWPVRFSHVTESGQPFLVAALTRKIDKRIWIICGSVHSQETFYEALLNWDAGALFLPEAEFAAVENVLPDPEIAAERLALFASLGHEARRRVIVATRAQTWRPSLQFA